MLLEVFNESLFIYLCRPRPFYIYELHGEREHSQKVKAHCFVSLNSYILYPFFDDINISNQCNVKEKSIRVHTAIQCLLLYTGLEINISPLARG